MDTKVIQISKSVAHQAAFIGLLRGFTSASQAILDRQQITPMAYAALLEIGTAPEPLSMNGLATNLGVLHNSAVSVINRLQEQGLVMRERSQRDRRIAHLSLTVKGEQVLEDLAAANSQALKGLNARAHAVFA